MVYNTLIYDEKRESDVQAVDSAVVFVVICYLFLFKASG